MTTTAANISKDLGIIPPQVPLFFLNLSNPLSSFKPKSKGDKLVTSKNDIKSFSEQLDRKSKFKKGSKDPIARFSRKAFTLALAFGSGGFGGFFGGSGNAKAVALYPLGGDNVSAICSEKTTKNVLILMSNTGGGHKASAEAIKAAFRERYGDEYKIDIVDLWKEHTPPPLSSMPDSYSFMVKHSLLWRAAYGLTNPQQIHVPYLTSMAYFCRRGIGQALVKYRPDLLVSVHPLMQHVPIRILCQRIQQGIQDPINFATVVTDFTTCHNTWFSAAATRCFVPTDFARGLALTNGLNPKQIVQHGLPIRPVFSKPLPCRDVLRSKLGLLPNLPAVLLVGGGEGMGRLQATVEEIQSQIGSACQVVVICGRNRKLQEEISSQFCPSASKPNNNTMHVLPLGFVDNLHEFMAACDVIVTKAGPGTVAEALISGLPILLNGFIPCQEEGNIPYVLENEVGAFEEDPKKIAIILRKWLAPEFREEFQRMAARSKALGRPESVYRIVDDLKELTDTPDFEFGPSAFSICAQRKTQSVAA
mmetsp:Transcript_14653/g.25772  ORF Transcript_14653/g.25772 Transcript_14653/m.25772 type:complete len:533 (+) Transcript_14653:29-1627(+)